jgi:phenylacetate-CoA ligase
MNPLAYIQDGLVRWQYGRMERRLRTASPEGLAALSERRLLAAFHRAARLVPAYQRTLRQHAVDPDTVTTIEEFRRKVPIVDKETVFAANELKDLCVGGNLEGVSLYYSSSGHSGVFSYGVETRTAAANAALATEFALHCATRALDRRTLLVNGLPMGVRIHTRTLPVVETGLRADSIWAILTKLRADFQQFILVGEQLFIKKIVEEGAERGLPWKDMIVHVVTGAEYMAENFRTYLGSILGTDFDVPEKGMVLVNFGLSELSLSIFQENAHTIRIRRRAHEDPSFREAIYGRKTSICPNLMQYYPQQTFIETVPGPDGRSELVVSLLDPELKIPLIRYNTKDVVETMTHGRLAEILKDFRCDPSLLPPFRLPLGIIWGKFQPLVTEKGVRIAPESVKEGLYSNPNIADKITGNFRLSEDKTGVRLLLQVRKGKEFGAGAIDALEGSLRAHAGEGIQVCPTAYEQFPYGMEQDFQRKNQYVG